jgi:hypothetical protein
VEREGDNKRVARRIVHELRRSIWAENAARMGEKRNASPVEESGNGHPRSMLVGWFLA